MNDRIAVAVRAVALAAIVAASARAQSTRPALPEAIEKNRVAVRVVGPDGAPIEIDDVSLITIQIDAGPWRMGPKPEVIDRYADGWATVDAKMFALRNDGGQPTEITFTSAGATMTATGTVPAQGVRRIEFTAAAPPSAFGVDLSAGPANVAADEVAGRVVDPNGKPVAGAVVSLPSGEGMPAEMRDFRAPVTTDADGVFRFADFSQQWFLTCDVAAPGYATRRLADLPIGKPFTVRLDDTTRLRGTLALPDGKPAANATITLVTSKPTARPRMASPIGWITQTFAADASGRYDVAVEPGTYDAKVVAADGTAVARVPTLAVAMGRVVALPATLEAGTTLRLRAVDAQTGNPVAGARFFIAEHRPGMVTIRPGTQRATDAAGTVVWEHLATGREIVSVSADGYSRWWVDGTDPQIGRGISDLVIDVAPGMSDVVVKMEPATSVRGVLLAPDGKPVANATVDIAGLNTGDSRYARKTDAEGRFTIAFPTLNDMPHAASRPTAEYAIVAFDQGGHWANVVSERFEPKVGESREMTLRMTLGGRVTGRVVDPSGKPVAGIEVEAVPDDGMDRQYYNPRQVTDADGKFDLGPMRPATYELEPDTRFGVNTARGERRFERSLREMDTGKKEPAIAEQPLTKVTVVEGEEQTVTLTYDGPPPPPVPDRYFDYGGNRKIAATTRPSVRR